MSINTRLLSFSLEARADGFHDLVFGSDNVENQLLPPDNYDDKLSWLDRSFKTYLQSVSEIQSLKKQSK